MIRLPLLIIAAALLPTVGAKPGERFAKPIAPSVHAGALLPHAGLPKIPSFKHKHNSEMALVDRRLRDLVVQQESWYAKFGSYGRDVERIGEVARGDSAAARVVRVTVLYAGKQGWAALASHPGAPGKTCVAYVGNRERLPLVPRSRADGKVASMEGIPACDAG